MDFSRMMAYCTALEAHNERPWFHENHEWYKQAVGDYLNLLDLVRFSIAENAPALSEDILYMQPSDWMYRVARDARVNRNKPPYDPSFRAYISRDRRSWQPIGYFLRIAPQGSCFGTGLFCDNAAAANRARDYMLLHTDEFSNAMEAAGIPPEGDRLKRMPRGYEDYADSVLAPWLKMKNWSVLQPLGPEQLRDFPTFDAAVRQYARQMEPMRLFLLEASRKREGHLDKQVRDFYENW